MTASESLNNLGTNSEFVAAADLGSNSFHLVIARYDNDRLVVVDRIKEIVRLGGGQSAGGHQGKKQTPRGVLAFN